MKIATTAFLFAALFASHCTPCASETPRADSPPVRGGSTRSLVVQANEAFRRGAFVSPAGDNALELLIAARDLDPSDRSVEVALLELFPIALAAADAHVVAGRRGEAARIVALIDRAVPNSTTVARMRRQLHVPGQSDVALVTGQ